MDDLVTAEPLTQPTLAENFIIPQFPQFERLNLAHKKSIEAYAQQHKPYSTFNFTNLWAWDTRNTRMISELNGNLVVLFTDYKTSEPFLSFLGTNKCKDTIHTILGYAKEKGISPVLRFVTEESIDDLHGLELYIEEDCDSSDYIFSTALIAKPQGSQFKQKRRYMQKFVHEYPDAHFELKDICDPAVHKEIILVLRNWERKKISDNKECNLEHEERALNRVLESANIHELLLSCVTLEGVMIGFSIDEIIHHKYAIAHFIKADNSYKGVYEFINEKSAQHLIENGITFWNWQQDLGISGLRKLKMSYRPVNFLKKYKVSFEKLSEKISATEKKMG